MSGVEFIIGGFIGSVVTAGLFILNDPRDPDIEVYHHD